MADVVAAASAPGLRETLEHGAWGRHLGDRISFGFDRINELFWLTARPHRPVDSLGRRQFEIAQLATKGLANKKIAERLNLAPVTVQNHLEAVYRKLGIHTRAELAALLSQLW